MVFRKSELFFIGLLTVTLLMNLSDFMHDYNELSDYHEGSYSWHIMQEGFVALASFGGIVFLLLEVMRRRSEMAVLKQQLQQMQLNYEASNEKLLNVKRSYRESIEQQFKEWNFTPSESNVAFLLLKGLSFEEIAMLRETKEKTVRQQASSIYRKSNISGRYEFAAWFFEDFI